MARVDRNFQLVTGLLEKVVAQTQDPPDVPVELARLYADWAAHDLTTNNQDAALEHLLKAHAHRPALFEVAFPLATVQAERGDRDAAVETLRLFIGTSKVAAETAKAREFLAKLSEGE
jgi:lipopolysaccharide biosynthesis regulator YciM